MRSDADGASEAGAASEAEESVLSESETSDRSVRCPHCGRGTAIAAGAATARAGDAVECTHCDRSFLLAGANGSTVAERALPFAAAVTATTVRSPVSTRDDRPARADAPLASTGLIAAALTAVFFLGVVGPLAHTSFGEILGNRGWVQYAITFLSIWSGVLLAWKVRRLRAEARVFELDLLPASIAPRIDAASARAFRTHLRALPEAVVQSFLVQRLVRALEHFEARGSRAEVVDTLRAQAERDEATVESSFAMLRVFIWAVPILGFIGTVIGIGQSVGGFSDSVATAADLSVMKDSIGAVTSGLGVAFDTTLLALVMSIFIMFPTSSLQKAEEEGLARVDDFCQRELVARLDESPARAADAPTAPDFADRVADRLAERLLDALARRGTSG